MELELLAHEVDNVPGFEVRAQLFVGQGPDVCALRNHLSIVLGQCLVGKESLLERTPHIPDTSCPPQPLQG
jgi:hypothetical protein